MIAWDCKGIGTPFFNIVEALMKTILFKNYIGFRHIWTYIMVFSRNSLGLGFGMSLRFRFRECVKLRGDWGLWVSSHLFGRYGGIPDFWRQLGISL